MNKKALEAKIGRTDLKLTSGIPHRAYNFQLGLDRPLSTRLRGPRIDKQPAGLRDSHRRLHLSSFHLCYGE